MPIFRRRPNPPSYSNYRRYKQILREDFDHRCAYCLLHEGDPLGAGFHNFHIDHFRPKSKFPELVSTYANLYYACRWCNGDKNETWPLPEERQRRFRFVDPCAEDLYKTHAKIDAKTGKLEPKN